MKYIFSLQVSPYKFLTAFCILYLEIYKKFDGLMHPELNHDKLKELQSKEASQQSWWKSITKFPGAVAKFIKSHVPSFSETKHLPVVKTYLEPYCKFVTGETDLNLTPLEVVDEIVYTIESLIKSSFYVESSHRCLLAADVKKVHNYRYIARFCFNLSIRDRRAGSFL